MRRQGGDDRLIDGGVPDIENKPSLCPGRRVTHETVRTDPPLVDRSAHGVDVHLARDNNGDRAVQVLHGIEKTLVVGACPAIGPAQVGHGRSVRKEPQSAGDRQGGGWIGLEDKADLSPGGEGFVLVGGVDQLEDRRDVFAAVDPVSFQPELVDRDLVNRFPGSARPDRAARHRSGHRSDDRSVSPEAHLEPDLVDRVGDSLHLGDSAPDPHGEITGRLEKGGARPAGSLACLEGRLRRDPDSRVVDRDLLWQKNPRQKPLRREPRGDAPGPQERGIVGIRDHLEFTDLDPAERLDREPLDAALAVDQVAEGARERILDRAASGDRPEGQQGLGENDRRDQTEGREFFEFEPHR